MLRLVKPLDKRAMSTEIRKICYRLHEGKPHLNDSDRNVSDFSQLERTLKESTKQQDNLYIRRIIPSFRHATLAPHIGLNRIFIHILYTHLFLLP